MNKVLVSTDSIVLPDGVHEIAALCLYVRRYETGGFADSRRARRDVAKAVRALLREAKRGVHAGGHTRGQHY